MFARALPCCLAVALVTFYILQGPAGGVWVRSILNITTMPRHQELIDSLTELYLLLDSLAVLPDDTVRLPPHGSNAFNQSAMRAAGYTNETVDLICALPYLAVDDHELSLELCPSSYPITYLGDDKDAGYFEWYRELYVDDQVIPPTAIKLTHNEQEGTEYIYDTNTKRMVAWNMMSTTDDFDHYFNHPAGSPRRVLGPLIDNYRQLRYVRVPDDYENYFDYDLVPPRMEEEPLSESAIRWRRATVASQKAMAAVRGLRDVYLECGWNLAAGTQIEFRRAEFIEKRTRYLREIVQPLVDERDRLNDEARQPEPAA